MHFWYLSHPLQGSLLSTRVIVPAALGHPLTNTHIFSFI